MVDADEELAIKYQTTLEGLEKLREIEFWEHEYLEQIYYLLSIDKDKMLDGISTKEDIRHDWEKFLGKQISKSAVGSERIFYWLFNQLGIPNSSPIGSDLFFETYNAYIHIDVKTDKITNIGDFNGEVTIQNNQTSYSGWILKQRGNHCKYDANLPPFYTKSDGSEKICLTYFISILYDEKEFKPHCVILTCMPNGWLYNVYQDDILKAGKQVGNPPKCTARYKWRSSKYFELLDGKNLRTKVLIWNPDEDISENKLQFVKEIYEEQFGQIDAIVIENNIKYHDLIKETLINELMNPSDEFVEIIGKRVYEGVLTQNIKENFSSLISEIYSEIIDENIEIEENMEYHTINQK